MSTRGSIFETQNIQMCKNVANSESGINFIGGYICQSRHEVEAVYALPSPRQDLVYFTPGVHLNINKDTKGQQYRKISEAIERDGCDFIIVGRGITESSNIKETANMYRQEGWRSYLNMILKK